ncbi:MAG: fibronectin type III domain-containing protein [Deltaproteobacteria bacterium]|nr:MAG: fibronectin type III domain-containing protein [Deltaproteobacteria bacterium]
MALDITLAWDASSSDVDGYRAFYREPGHSYDYSQPAWEGWETTCTIYGLDEETTYYFVVRAYNDLGESGNSNEASSADPGTGIGTGVGTGAEAGGCFIASACKG